MPPKRRRTQQDPSRAVAYLRVSTEDQALGPEAQRASIEAWTVHQGIQVLAWHLDQGVSGATPLEEREGLRAALRDIEGLRAGLLVVAKWDRIARDVVIAAMTERLVERMGARVVSADGVGAGSGPEAALMRNMVAAFAAYERALIAARTSAALRALRARGQRAGAVPLGFRLDTDGKVLLPNEDEQVAAAYASWCREGGLSYRLIARELDKKGFKPRGTRWHAMTVRRLIATYDLQGVKEALDLPEGLHKTDEEIREGIRARMRVKHA